MNNQLAILVISCDSYSDAWEPFFSLLTKFWKDCPYKCYLGTNKIDFSYPNVTVLQSGNDISWADNTRKYLDKISEDYVLTFLDDFFLSFPVSTKNIEKAFQDVLRYNIDVYSLNDPKKGKSFKKGADFNLIDPNSDYCINTAIAIRKKNTFYDMLKPGYSAWDFEIKNSRDINKSGSFNGIYVTSKKSLFIWKNGIIQKKWVPSSVMFCRKMNIPIDTTIRPMMNLSDVFWENIKDKSNKYLPKVIKLFIKKIFIKIGFKDRFVSSF